MLKYILIIGLFSGCSEFKDVHSQGTKVTINGKDCELVMIDSAIRFVDCGIGSSMTLGASAKEMPTGQFIPTPQFPISQSSNHQIIQSPDGGVIIQMTREYSCVCQ